MSAVCTHVLQQGKETTVLLCHCSVVCSVHFVMMSCDNVFQGLWEKGFVVLMYAADS